MHDDESMDRLLRETMGADVPTLSPGFEARVMQRVRPRRLARRGRVAMALYVIVAVLLVVMTMRDLPAPWVLLALVAGLSAAAAASAYVRRVAVGS